MHTFLYFSFRSKEGTFENIITKGEVDRKQQFLLEQQCFHIYLYVKPLFHCDDQ